MAGAGIIKAGRAAVEAFLDTSPLKRDVKNMGRELQKVGLGIAKAGAGITAAGAAIVAPFALAIKTFSRVGDELDKLNQKTGVTVESLSQLGFIAEQNGASLGTVGDVLKNLNTVMRSAERGSARAVENLAALGLTFEDLKNLSPEERLLKVADALKAIQDQGQREGLANQLFGGAGVQLLPMLQQGADAIREAMAAADASGLTVSTEQAKNMAALNDAWNLLRRQFVATAGVVANSIAPALVKALKVVTDFVPNVIEWAKRNEGLIKSIAAVGAGLVGVGATITTIGAGIAGSGVAITGIVSGLSAVGGMITGLGSAIAAVLAPPQGFLVAGLVAAAAAVPAVVAGTAAMGAAFLHFSGIGKRVVTFFRERFGGLADTFNEVKTSIMAAFSDGGIEKAARVAWEGVQKVFAQGLNDVVGLFRTSWGQVQAIITGKLVAEPIQLDASAADELLAKLQSIESASASVGIDVSGLAELRESLSRQRAVGMDVTVDTTQVQALETAIADIEGRGISMDLSPLHKQLAGLEARVQIDAQGVSKISVDAAEIGALSQQLNGIAKVGVEVDGLDEFRRIVDNPIFVDGKLDIDLRDVQKLRKALRGVEKQGIDIDLAPLRKQLATLKPPPIFDIDTGEFEQVMADLKASGTLVVEIGRNITELFKEGTRRAVELAGAITGRIGKSIGTINVSTKGIFATLSGGLRSALETLSVLTSDWDKGFALMQTAAELTWVKVRDGFIAAGKGILASAKELFRSLPEIAELSGKLMFIHIQANVERMQVILKSAFEVATISARLAFAKIRAEFPKLVLAAFNANKLIFDAQQKLYQSLIGLAGRAFVGIGKAMKEALSGDIEDTQKAIATAQSAINLSSPSTAVNQVVQNAITAELRGQN